MAVSNVRIKRVKAEIGGKVHELFYSMGSAAVLAEAYGSAGEAERKLYAACFNKKGKEYVSKSADELMSIEFLSILKNYVFALTNRDLDIYDIGVDELPKIISAVLEAIGLGNPEPKESSEGSGDPIKAE
jgi:hypothetical protein